MKPVLLALLFSFFSLTTGAQGLPDFTQLVASQGPAVVNISTTQLVRGAARDTSPFGEDEDMAELFRRFLPRPPGTPNPALPREFATRSLGSGFIISSDGYILTNAHVIEAADEILVRLTDKREFKAKVLGADKRTDVALIKIEASALPVVRMGDPEQLRVGEWVVAIGSPFGFDNSVTAGIVSAKGRSLPQENLVPFIQTDVAINPGNSGGPLFNLKGEVVGVNSQIYSRSGGFMGISFAIPIDVAIDVQAQLQTSGRVRRGRIGVGIQEVTKALADSFGLDSARGAIVNFVEKGGPAEQGGVEPGDVILSFAGKPVPGASDLPRIVTATKPGERVAMQVWRQRGARELSVVVADTPEEKPAAERAQRTAPAEQPPNRLGLVVADLSAEQKREFKLGGGVFVRSVRGSAQRAGMRAGDLIIALVASGQRTEVGSVDEFNALLAALGKDESVTLLVRRGERQSFFTIRSLAGEKAAQ